MQFEVQIKELGNKTKKVVDIVYIVMLFLFMSAYACRLTSASFAVFEFLYNGCSTFFYLIAVYRLFFLYFSDRKQVILPLALILLGVVIFLLSDNNIIMQTAVIAVAGIGFSADRILFAGISGNIVMILNNIVMSLKREPGVYTVDNQPRNYFFLGNNTIFVSKLNNYSSTDLAAHYFWTIAAYLWVRGKKILWGEIFALAGLNILVYSLSASKTAFLCISILLMWATAMKLYLLIKKLTEKKRSNSEGSGNQLPFSNLGSVVSRIFTFCCRYSYLIFAVLCISLALLFSCFSPFFLNLNNSLHWRLSLGRRGITEYGIHLVASDVPVFGMSSSIDGFYNFIDCSYVAILVRNGILALAFFLFSMTFIQIKHKKYVYGLVILAVCALSCMEEHHMFELPYNMFMLLVFADLEAEKKAKNPIASEKKTLNIGVNAITFVLCAVFSASAVAIYYPRYKAVKELDLLDEKAGVICASVQNNLNLKVDDGSWQKLTSAVSSSQYGLKLDCPSDFYSVTGTSWAEAIDDPKVHSYFSLYYDAQVYEEISNPMLNLMITDEVRYLIGDGSVVIEYDIVTGKVYSVWYAETKGCYAIEDGRLADRVGRLRTDVAIIEGYSTGIVNG